MRRFEEERVPEPYVPKPPVAPDDAAYLAAARAEAEFWSRPQIYSIDAWWGAALGPIKRHYNRRLTGDERTPWYEVVAQRGPFRRGLVLGCGGMVQDAGILETNPGLHLTFCDIDASGLAKRAEAFGARFPGRVETRQIDLNFAALEPARYDVIISANTLHHIVNLEHVATQIAAALADDGWFFLYDYTGESGMRFPAEQKRVFELIYERERARNPELPPITWHDVSDGTYSPFEAIRGGETIGILRQHLDEVERRSVGAVMGLLFFAGLLDGGFDARKAGVGSRIRRALRRSPDVPSLVWEEMLSDQCLTELALLDELVCDAAFFRPNNTFAVYRKPA
jgi:SAM-dependent methyltransferase